MDAIRKTGAGMIMASLFSGCAATPPKPGTPGFVFDGRQTLHLSAITWIEAPAGMRGPFQARESSTLEGAVCTARNGKGAWEAATPGTVDVFTGGGPLRIECALAGYRTARVELSCTSPRTRSAIQGAITGLQLMAGAGQAAVFMAPAVVLGILVGSTALGAAAGSATAGPDADVCDYSQDGYVQVWMEREDGKAAP